MTQLTIVTHYGNKPPFLANLIFMLQTQLADSLGAAFIPYEMEQVHGTIIGLEVIVTDKGLVNKWFKENLKRDENVDIAGLLEFVRSDRIGEISVRIGGWKPHKDYGFESKNQHPYLRSFSFRGAIAVTMGWPVEKAKYCESLYNLRKRFEEFKFFHKHNKDGYKDNDFFFVLGCISKKQVNPTLLQQTATEMRLILSGIERTVSISKDTLSIVAYIDTQLPVTTSEAFSINDKALTTQLVERLYKQNIIFRSR